jgi:hypothetical protein
MQVMVTATLDPRDGTAREVVPAESDRARVSGDPRLRAFFERARRAILDPRCGKELVQQQQIASNTSGTPTTLTFRFRP